MVEVGSTFDGIEDTRFVHLEDSLIGLNGDGDWSKGDSGLQLVDRLWLDIMDLHDEDLTFGGISFAMSVLGGVWVDSLKFLSVDLGVLHGGLLETTLASH